VRISSLLVSLVLSAVFLIPSAAQQPAAANTQAAAFLQRAFAALSGGQSLSDVTLSGAARRIAGADDETGTGVFKAISSGASRVELSLPSGKWSEILSTSPTQPSGSWTGPDGLSHEMAFHNLLAGSSWFFPTFPIVQGLSASGYIATYVGRQTHNGQAVEHISVSQNSPSSIPHSGVTYQHLSQLDFFLDPTTLLPEAMIFNMHPDNNALVDIPIEVRFSDYRPVNGARVAFHVQKYMNESLMLDFQAQSVTLNSGLSANQFTVQ
jgi:hypothetical protein